MTALPHITPRLYGAVDGATLKAALLELEALARRAISARGPAGDLEAHISVAGDAVGFVVLERIGRVPASLLVAVPIPAGVDRLERAAYVELGRRVLESKLRRLSGQKRMGLA